MVLFEELENKQTKSIIHPVWRNGMSGSCWILSFYLDAAHQVDA
jgi:hypothetical protein